MFLLSSLSIMETILFLSANLSFEFSVDVSEAFLMAFLTVLCKYLLPSFLVFDERILFFVDLWLAIMQFLAVRRGIEPLFPG